MPRWPTPMRACRAGLGHLGITDVTLGHSRLRGWSPTQRSSLALAKLTVKSEKLETAAHGKFGSDELTRHGESAAGIATVQTQRLSLDASPDPEHQSKEVADVTVLTDAEGTTESRSRSPKGEIFTESSVVSDGMAARPVRQSVLRTKLHRVEIVYNFIREALPRDLVLISR